MMMPGLRDFVLEAPAEDPANASERLPVALAALAQAFTVVSEPGASGSGVRRRIWLDTFDWRLYRAGLVLEVEQASRGGRLLLTDGSPLAEQPVTGWPPRRPATDLPPGPVRDRIAALISPRALLPVARGVSTVSAMRLLNADGKIVARLIVDRPAVTEAGNTAELAPRLSVAEVRGYPAQARKVASLLAAVPGVTPVDPVAPAQHSVFTAALASLGREPGDYTNGIDAQITAQLPASVAVARILLRLLDTLELNVDGVLRDIDTEFLHDLRVAVRRTRSALKLLGGVLPAALVKPYANEFKWLGDLTTPTRDLDVHLLGFAAMAEQLQAASPADLEPFRAFLARRRVREFRRLAAGLRSARFVTLTRDWRKALLEIRDAGAARKRRPKRELTTVGVAMSTTGRAFGRIAALGGAITPDSPPESLHDLRKRGKELRYLLEFFAPLHDPVAYKKVVSDLKQLQDGLGDFQDNQVQREEIGVLADAMLAETVRSGAVRSGAVQAVAVQAGAVQAGAGLAGEGVPAATLLAMGEVAARLAVSQAQARADFARRFARFAGPAAQPRIRALLGETSTPPVAEAPDPTPRAAPVKAAGR